MATVHVNPSYVDDSVQLNRTTTNTISDLVYRYYRDAAGLAVPFEVESVDEEGEVPPTDEPVK